MTLEEQIFREFESEKGYDPITTSDCELTNWLIKKLIEAKYLCDCSELYRTEFDRGYDSKCRVCDKLIEKE